MARRPTIISEIFRTATAPFVIAALAMLLCYAAAGNSLGFYLGPVMTITLILPPMVAAQRRFLDAIVVAGAMIDAVGIAWLLAVFGPDLTFMQWLQCYFVLAAYALALMAIARATAAWLAVILGVAWLTWPVWTAPFLNITLTAWLTPAHPLMAINSVVIHLGAWAEQPLMYQHATLNQDVPYTLPRSIWPCVIVHSAIALALLAPGWWRARGRAMSSAAAAEPTAAPPA
jgi:hypothetical protein